MQLISTTLKIVLWSIVGVATLVTAILGIVLEPNLAYIVRKIAGIKGRVPTKRPLWIWILFWFSSAGVIFGTAVASTLPDNILTAPTIETSRNPISTPFVSVTLTPSSTPPPIEYPVDWLYSKLEPFPNYCETNSDWTSEHKSLTGNNYICDFFSYPVQQTWELRGAGEFKYPIVANNIVYMVDGEGNIIAANLSDGKVIWRQKVLNARQLSYDNGNLYSTGSDNKIYKINATTGSTELIFSANQSISTPPFIYNNNLFAVGYSGEIYSVNTSTGNLNWSLSIEEANAYSITMYDNLIYITSGNGIIHAINIDTGKQIWDWQIGYLNNRAPTIFDGILYVVGTKVYAIDAKSGAKIWEQTQKGLFEVESISVDENLIYIPTQAEYSITALDRLTGELRWKTKLSELVSPRSPAINSRYLITRTTESIILLDKYRGTILSKQPIPPFQEVSSFPSVVISGTTLIINNGEKIIVYQSDIGKMITIGEHLKIWDSSKDTLVQISYPEKFILDCVPTTDTQLVCASAVDNARINIYDVNLVSNQVKLLSSYNITLDVKSAATISPDGKRVAITTGTGTAFSFYIDRGNFHILNTDGSKDYFINNEFCGSQDSITWSPDSKYMAYPKCVGIHPQDAMATSSQMAIVNVNAETENVIADLEQNYSFFSWSPDGLWIAYTSYGLYVTTPDGITKKQVADNDSGFLGWDPSAQYLTLGGDGIFLTGMNTKDRFIDQDGGTVLIEGDPFGWSRDGKYVAMLDLQSETLDYIVNIYEIATGKVWKSVNVGNRDNNFIDRIKWIP